MRIIDYLDDKYYNMNVKPPLVIGFCTSPVFLLMPKITINEYIFAGIILIADRYKNNQEKWK